MWGAMRLWTKCVSKIQYCFRMNHSSLGAKKINILSNIVLNPFEYTLKNPNGAINCLKVGPENATKNISSE